MAAKTRYQKVIIRVTSRCVKTVSVSALSSCLLEIECEVGAGKCEESLMTLTEATSAPSGPSGLVVFGRMVQKHSYVSALIIMMVNIGCYQHSCAMGVSLA